MTRKLTLILGAIAIAALAAGPVAASTAAATNAPIVVTEPIDDFNVHPESDGSTLTSRQLGTRTTKTFPDGRYMLDESYTVHQVYESASGALIYDSTGENTVKVILDGERTVLFRSVSDTTTTLGDGSVCTTTFEFMVANDKVVKQESTGPICS